MSSRRNFIHQAILGTGSLFLSPANQTLRAAPLPGGTLDPLKIPKYKTPLVIPPAMPRTNSNCGVAYYEIAVRQFSQQILPSSDANGRRLNPTPVWGYGSANHSGSFNYPSFTIEAAVGEPVRVKWMNQLVDAGGNYLQHLLPVDQTLHWANPPGPVDMHTTKRERYTGPVPLIPHLHGGRTTSASDGYPEAWWLPAAKNLSGFVRKGSRYASPYGSPDDYLSGAAVFQYGNDQRASTLWYHDHALGMTRLNVYAGPAGFYNLRGGSSDLAAGVLPGPAPQLGDRNNTDYYEIPIVIQDRSFNADGTLFYPDSRAFFDDSAPDFLPPIWNPEFFGNTMVVNGQTWPYLKVEARRYRFRLLNGAQSRTLILRMALGDPGSLNTAAPFHVIGTEGGFLPKPVQLDRVLIGNAERLDVIVDFSGMAGTKVFLVNEGPDGPFNGAPNVDPADPATTGQVMKFVVVEAKGYDKSTPPGQLRLPALPRTPGAHRTRRVALFEDMVAGRPRAALLGTPSNGPRMWMDPITEKPGLGETEIWEIYNKTADAHPIHLHEVMFQVLNRQNFELDYQPVGLPSNPATHESGFKDTVISYPNQVTRIKATFDLPSLFVWHCHILEHEDNEMMRPYVITQNPSVALGEAVGYALLALDGGKVKMSGSGSRVYGDVGIGPDGSQEFSDGCINGTVFLSPTADVKKADAAVTGGTAPRNLNGAIEAVRKASQAALKLKAGRDLGKLKSGLTIQGKDGLNVLRADSIDLKKGESLTLSGSASAEFVLNVEGKLKLDGSSIRVTGALVSSRVLIVGVDDVEVNGGGLIQATVLATGKKVTLKDSSSILGAVYAGGDVSIERDSVIRYV